MSSCISKVKRRKTIKFVYKIVILKTHFCLIYKRRPFVDHLVERFFKQIIECSDVGINPEDEEELEELRAYGLETGEKEDKSEYVLKVSPSQSLHF